MALNIPRNEYSELAAGNLSERESVYLREIACVLHPLVTEAIANGGSFSTPIDFGDNTYVLYSFESCNTEYCGDTAGYLHAEYIDWEYRVFPSRIKLPYDKELLFEATRDVTCRMWYGLSQILIDSDFDYRVVTENTKDELDKALDRITNMRRAIESVVNGEFVLALNAAIGEGDVISFDHLEFVPLSFNIHGVDYENLMPKPNRLIEGYDTIAVMAHYNDSYHEKMNFILKAEYPVRTINDESFGEAGIVDHLRESSFEHIDFLPEERAKHKKEVHSW